MPFLILSLFIGAMGFIKEGAIIEIIGDEMKEFHREFHDQIRIINFYAMSFNTPYPFNTVFFHAA